MSEFSDEDMADVGRALMEAIEAHAPKGWHPSDCPSEIVGDMAGEIDELRAQLAALKQAQGDPVATLHDDGYWSFTASAPASLKHTSNHAGWRLPVFASAPTIPEGWRPGLIKEAIAALEIDGLNVSLCADLRAMLAAAPKQGEVA